MCDCVKIKNTDEYVIAWKAWYNDGTENIQEFDSIKDCLEKLPDDGFQAMKLWYADGNNRYMSGNDFYFFCEHPAGIIFGQSNDLDIKERYPDAIIKRGKHIPDLLLKKIDDIMINSEIPHGS